jgi:hypothetical protein
MKRRWSDGGNGTGAQCRRRAVDGSWRVLRFEELDRTSRPDVPVAGAGAQATHGISGLLVRAVTI